MVSGLGFRVAPQAWAMLFPPQGFGNRDNHWDFAASTKTLAI